MKQIIGSFLLSRRKSFQNSGSLNFLNSWHTHQTFLWILIHSLTTGLCQSFYYEMSLSHHIHKMNPLFDTFWPRRDWVEMRTRHCPNQNSSQTQNTYRLNIQRTCPSQNHPSKDHRTQDKFKIKTRLELLEPWCLQMLACLCTSGFSSAMCCLSWQHAACSTFKSLLGFCFLCYFTLRVAQTGKPALILHNNALILQ